MRLFGKTRSSKGPTAPSVEPYPESTAGPVPVIFQSPRDKYGMINPDEEEIPTPAVPGMEAPVDFGSGSNEDLAPTNGGVPTPRRRNRLASKEDIQVSNNDNKKSKKKKRKKKKKKKHKTMTGEEEEDLPIVVDRTPTAMEYESDDSIEKMIDEKSRYSRYTTEHDEINLEKFDEDLEEKNDIEDKYGGNASSYPIAAALSDESNPATWHSDEEDEHKSKSMRGPEKGSTNALTDLGFESAKRNGGRKKKYQDLQSFQKKRSSSSKVSSGMEHKNDYSFQFPNIGAMLSPTKQPGASEKFPRSTSDTSSLTDPLHKHEKYTAQLAKQRNSAKSQGNDGLPSEILAAQSQQQKKRMLIPITSSESSDNLHHRYKIEDEVVSPTAEEKLVELDRHMARISASESGSISFLGEQEMLRDRYAELEAASSRSSDRRKKKNTPSGGNKDSMYYTKSLMVEDESSIHTNDSPKPLGRVEKTKRGQMKELDEYSLTMSVQDTPALVQCLKFYHCGAAVALADVATGGWFSTQDNVAKEVELLGRRPELSEVEKLRYRENEDDMPPRRPVVRGRSVSSKASKARSAGLKQPSNFDGEQEYEIESMIDDEEDDSKFDEVTIDAPDIAAVDPNSNRYLREVTALSLRLDDGDDQQTSRSTPERGRKMAREFDDGIKIREISIPRSSSSKKSRKEKKQRKESGVLHETQNHSEQRAILDAQSTIRDVKDSKRDESGQPQQMSVMKPATDMDFDENVESPEMDIVNKKSSGGNSEKLKKGLSGVFSRFGRRGKKANV